MFTDLKKNCRLRPRTIGFVLFFALLLIVPSRTPAADKFSSAELDTLVSTIALYPDPLLAQVLAASVYGDEIPGASDWANQHRHLKGDQLAQKIANDDLPYDASVQALIPFPSILATMAKYQMWTEQLGDAVSSQKDEVMDAVQRLRNSAYNHGHLQSDKQVKVIKEKTIIIEPVQKEYIYVPVYNPHVVYYQYANGYTGLRYRSGVWLGDSYGTWGWGSCWFEWDNHLIYVRDYRWHHNRPVHRHPPRYNSPPKPNRYDNRPSNNHRQTKISMSHRNAPISSHDRQIQEQYQTEKDWQNQRNFTPEPRRQNLGNVTTTHKNENRENRDNNRQNSNQNRGGFGKSIRR